MIHQIISKTCIIIFVLDNVISYGFYNTLEKLYNAYETENLTYNLNLNTNNFINLDDNLTEKFPY